jgi:phosphocarrier protein HPr
MPSQILDIINKRGLHARAAAKLAATCAKFASKIQLRKTTAENWVDGKSIMSIMLLAAGVGTQIEVSTDGDDADTALIAIEELVANRFEEDE